VGLAPRLHALDIFRVPEVLPIGGFLQPAALALGFAGLAASRLGAKLLMPAVPIVRSKQDFAMQTLAWLDWGHPPTESKARPK